MSRRLSRGQPKTYSLLSDDEEALPIKKHRSKYLPEGESDFSDNAEEAIPQKHKSSPGVIKDEEDDDEEVEVISEKLAKQTLPAGKKGEKRKSLGGDVRLFMKAVEISTTSSTQTTTKASTKRHSTLVTNASLTARKQASITSFFGGSTSTPTAPAMPRKKAAATPKPAVSQRAKPTPKITPRRKKASSDSGSDFEAPAESDGDEDFAESAVPSEDEDVVMEEVVSDVEEELPKKKGKKVVVKKSDIPSGVQVKDANLDADALPPLSDVQLIFKDIVRRVPAIKEVSEHLGSRKLRVGTMCSGTESPLLALGMITRSMKEQYGVTIEVEHLFSCEIEPFKQAYIERNFRPPILFRDITELGEDEATTAYGAMVKVPGDIDLLIAGTSCVDFSNLNTQKKGLEESGESGATFHGMLRYVKRHRPPIVVLENVSGGPWDLMVRKFEEIGYSAQYSRFDTKYYYIPHTRQRGYMIAVSTSGSSIPGKWSHLVKLMARPATSTLDAFLLPSDDPRIHKGRLALIAKGEAGQDRRSAVDWTRCESRHQKARVEEKLGIRRPLTNWQQQGVCRVPDFAWGDWARGQVERVLDLMDISTLRAAKGGVDPGFKTQVWNLSQNVDRTTASSKPGISPCLTPSMIPYITNRGGPMIGLEALSMQGLPIDELLLTRETQDQLADLAGNAMSTTVVGTAIIAALILSKKLLRSGESLMDIDMTTEEEDVEKHITGEEHLISHALDLKVRPTDLQSILAMADASSRLCMCEGRTDITTNPLQICEDCGFTSCKKCGGRPEHNYRDMTPEELARRVSPIKFEDKVKQSTPMRLRISGVTKADLEAAKDKLAGKLNQKIWDKWSSVVAAAFASEFRFKGLMRQETWSITYESPHGKLELLLDPKQPEWRVFVYPEITEPSGSELRKILTQPVARQKITDSVDFTAGAWELCLPVNHSFTVKVVGRGELVPAWEAVLGLEEPKFANKKVWSQLEIQISPDDMHLLDRDISGLYTYHQNCGNANASLHVKPGPTPLYFFLDPKSTSKGDDDYFVFALNNRRYPFGEERPIIARLAPSYRQNDSEVTTVTAHLDGTWVPLPGALGPPKTGATGTFAMPPAELAVPAHLDACLSAQAILVCRVPLKEQAERVWPRGKVQEVTPIQEKTVFDSIAWLTERVKTFSTFASYRPVSFAAFERCDRCAPKRPEIKWIKKKNKWLGIEDSLEAGPFEQALKHRPSPFVTQIMLSDDKEGLLRIGLNVATLVHRAFGQLPPAKGVTGWKAEWRLVTGYTAPPTVEWPVFEVRSNRRDEEARQPPHFTGPLKLRREQLRSLQWMVAQESDAAPPFVEEEVAEALLPYLGWRAEGRVTREVPIKGGVLADDVGYGKTACTIALISARHHLPSHPSSLLEDGMLKTNATLVIVPAHLTGQWKSEIDRFTERKFRTVVVSTQAQMNAVTVEDIQKADVVVVAASLFNSNAYLGQLAWFSKSKMPPGSNGRQYRCWLEEAVRALPGCVVGGGGGEGVFQAYRDELKRQLEEEAQVAQSKRLKGKAFSAALEAKKAGTTKPAAKGKKRKHANSDDEDDEMPEVEKEVVKDVWDLSSKVEKLGIGKLRAPNLALFAWNRLVVDEYTYDTPVRIRTAIQTITATNKWILSGTPPLEDFADVQTIASFLGVHLGIDDEGGIKVNGRKKLDSNRTEAEKFQAMSESHSPEWHKRRFAVAQRFLDQFMRKNVPEIDEIPQSDFYTLLPLPPAERAVYLELEHHLEALEMTTRRKGKKGTDSDRDKRLNDSMEKSSSGQEALIKRCSFFDLGRRGSDGLYHPDEACQNILQIRKLQLEQCKWEIRQALKAQEKAVAALGARRQKEFYYKGYCEHVKNTGVGDGQASKYMRELIDLAKRFPDSVEEKPMWDRSGEGKEEGGESDGFFDDDEEDGPRKKRKTAAKKGGKKEKAPAKAKAVKGKKAADEEEDVDLGGGKSQPKTESVDEDIWAIREKTHAIKRLDKELVGRTRSLRFFENVWSLQKDLSHLNPGAKQSDYTCVACHASLAPKEVALLSTCGHTGHYDCLLAGAEKERCLEPACTCTARTTAIVRASELVDAKSHSAFKPSETRYGTKMSTLVDLINSTAKDEKVLVFVQFQDLMDNVRRALLEAGIPTLVIEGNASSRSSVLQRFQTEGGDNKVLLLNVGDESASGANLTIANHCVFIAPLWTEGSKAEYRAVETQAVGRIRRYGQGRRVNVYRLWTGGTVDEWLFGEMVGGGMPGEELVL
ncbi:hypothetical protein BJ508DRAFT_333534 [Ascobolus immersus RN42]|uniref:Helicase C-terminal domain-containing protein n=1 Tax=Ascobolus immersus RN42 TaxID=1160509 RepID=A0A3N4HM25_ASCIM|nr:hypothetical protein BJ508DRAFT_333534 [Ascobolus immersus RN42]